MGEGEWRKGRRRKDMKDGENEEAKDEREGMQGGIRRKYAGLVWRGWERNEGRGRKCEEDRVEGEMSDEVEKEKGSTCDNLNAVGASCFSSSHSNALISTSTGLPRLSRRARWRQGSDSCCRTCRTSGPITGSSGAARRAASRPLTR